MKRFLVATILAVGGLLTACGGGDAAGPVETAAVALREVAQRASPLRAAPTWTPTQDGFMRWAEAQFPQFFPAQPLNQYTTVLVGAFRVRYYPQTDNVLALQGDNVWVLGTVSHQVPLYVGTLADFRCAMDAASCAETAPLPVIPGAVSTGPASPQVRTDVAAALTMPVRVDADRVVGDRMSDLSLFGSASGNIASLSGQTVYILVEDNHRLFQRQPPAVFRSGTSVSVFLYGAAALPQAGEMTGELKVHVCLDPACATVLAGSPLRVPYHVRVLPPVQAEAASIAATTPFGTDAAPRRVALTLPTYTTSWGATLLGASDVNSRMQVIATGGQGNTYGAATVYFLPSPAATYAATLRISGSATPPGGSSLQFTQDIPVTYTVTPDAATPVWVYPREIQAGYRQSIAATQHPTQGAWVQGNADVRLGSPVVEQVSQPAGAQGKALAASWFTESGSVLTIDGCTSECLPAGTYVARERFAYVRGGTSGTAPGRTITMTVNP